MTHCQDPQFSAKETEAQRLNTRLKNIEAGKTELELSPYPIPLSATHPLPLILCFEHKVPVIFPYLFIVVSYLLQRLLCVCAFLVPTKV
jgi:hypothetical protein